MSLHEEEIWTQRETLGMHMHRGTAMCGQGVGRREALGEAKCVYILTLNF